MKEEYRTAVWLALAAAVMMLGLSVGHCESPKRYEKRVERHTDSANVRLREVEMRDEQDRALIMWEVRGEWDLQLCREAMRGYRAGRVERGAIDHLLKQLDRDMEDFPPQETKP